MTIIIIIMPNPAPAQYMGHEEAKITKKVGVVNEVDAVNT